MNEYDGDDLNRLFDDAVADVHPSGTPDDIRRRAEEGSSPMDRTGLRRWAPISLAAAAAMVLVIGGTLWLTGRGEEAPPVAGSENSVQPSPTPSAPPQAYDSGIFYVGDTAAGPRIFYEVHGGKTTLTFLGAALKDLVEDPPQDPDYRRPLPADLEMRVSVVKDDAITIDLSRDLPGTGDPAEDRAALQAILFTVAFNERSQSTETPPVRFTVQGNPVTEVLGQDVGTGVTRASRDDALAPVYIEGPEQGTKVQSPFTVGGQAATFEGNVVWELKQGDTVVKHGFTTAKECCTLSPYEFTVEAPPGDYTLVVHDTDESDDEGSGITEDTKEITVG